VAPRGRTEPSVGPLGAAPFAAVLLSGCFGNFVLAELRDDSSAEAEADADPDVDVGVDADAGADVDVDVDADAGTDVDVDADAGPSTCSGGWYDPSSDLCWQDPPDETGRNWDAAVAYCNGLSLGGHGPGSWHLPNIDELRSLVRGCPDIETGGACRVTEACLGDGCYDSACYPADCGALGGPGAGGCYWPAGPGGPCLWYWSSSSYAGGASYAWLVDFYNGYVDRNVKIGTHYVRCVRRGP
jgi:hypothetical protein